MHLEKDSLVVIKAFRRNKISAWHIENYMVVIRKELDSLTDLKVSHVFREGNGKADMLSKWAANFKEEGDSQFEFCSRWREDFLNNFEINAS